MNIWQELPEHFTVLAPMEGVTDIVFRQVIAKAGRPDLFFTEFTNVSSFASEKGRANALERLAIAPTDKPIIAQIWGKNPEHFAELASALEGLGFQGLDINMGCPDRHVNKTGGGAAMIRTPELAVECIRQAKENTNLPVSVKTRLGFTWVEEYKDWLALLLEQNLAALTVHLRTRKEMSKVPAHYEIIPEIVKLRDEIAPKTKLVVNGDIKNLAQAEEIWAEYPEVNGVMIGRGVFEDPFCFTCEVHQNLVSQTRGRRHLSSQGRRPLRLVVTPTQSERLDSDVPAKGHKTPSFEGRAERGSASISAGRPWRRAGRTRSEKEGDKWPSSREKLDLLEYHLDLFDKYERQPFEPMRHFFKVYINGFEGAAAIRAKLMECKTTDEVREVLKNLPF